VREKLVARRQQLIEECINANPMFRGQQGGKLTKKLYIPIKEYPSYNFFGLIVGPRGRSQKKLESETGAKVAIRGRGSVKEGQAAHGQTAEDLDDEMHVLITAETQDSLNKATEVVQKLLVPVEDDNNEYKKAQLKELALMNGTMRDEPVGGALALLDKGPALNFIKPDVVCSICGDGSHPTRDCPMKVISQNPSFQP